MLEQISQALIEKCGLKRGEIVLLGVSGGPDSLCMLDVLRQLGYQLIVAHLDHGLRLESSAERAKIEQIAAEFGLPFVSQLADVSAHASENHLSIEEAARNLRYLFLFDQAQKAGAHAVAVGHTADDQIETVLMHLLRGSGTAGLGGMDYRSQPNPWSMTIPLIRPFLGTWRVEIMAYLAERNLEPSLDLTNQDFRFYRNRLRGEAIPYLETLNSGVRRRLWQTAEILRADEAALEQLVERLWGKAILNFTKDYLVIDGKVFSEQPLGIQRRLVRRAINTLRPGVRNIDFGAVERGLALVNTTTMRSPQVELAANLRMWREGEQLWLAKAEAELTPLDMPAIDRVFSAWIEPPAILQLPNGWQLDSQVLPAKSGLFDAIQVNPYAWQAWLDLDRVRLPLLVRVRQPGDRIRPLGLGGHSQKLSDFMINVQMPRRLRLSWPLVVAGAEIAWLPGYAVSESFAVRQETKRLLHLRLTQERPAVSGSPALI